MSVRRLTVDRTALGRASGASRMLTYGMRPVGAALGGMVGLAVDAEALFAVCTALALLAIVPLPLHPRAAGSGVSSPPDVRRASSEVEHGVPGGLAGRMRAQATGAGPPRTGRYPAYGPGGHRV
ncbi:hypothetical protein [Streptomyces eurythermus]|uniref:hypothetical protein n=1 Tax=Streptomyces eurythermus TaxID=42237 RepID=UPI003702D15F